MLDSIRNSSRSIGVKLIFGAIILVFMFWGVGNFKGGGVSNVATVNGEPITIQEFGSTFQRIFEAERQRTPELNSSEELQLMLRHQVLQQMVINVLWKQEAERLGLFVSPHELRESIARIGLFLDDNGKFSKDKYLSTLKAQNINVGQFEAEQTRELLMEKVQRYVTMGVSVTEAEARNYYDFSMEGRKAQYVLFAADDYLKGVEISDEAVNTYYAAHKEEFRTQSQISLTYLPLTPAALAAGYTISDADVEAYYKANEAQFSIPESYHVRHIFVEIPTDGAEPERAAKATEAQSRMADIQARLAGGESFEDLAIQFSDDESSKVKGGDLGWLDSGKIALPGIEEALASLKAGEVSKVLTTPFGLHLLRLEEKKPSMIRPLAEVKEDIRTDLARDKAEEGFRDMQRSVEDALAMGTSLKDLAKQYKVELQTTGLLSEEEAMERMGLHSDSRKLLQDAIAGMTPAALPETGKAAPAANATQVVNGTMPTTTTNATTQAAGASASNSTAPVQPAAASGPMVLPVPLNIVDGVALVSVDEVKPSMIRPLADVKAEILDVLQAEEATTLAQKAAAEALPTFTGKAVPAPFKDKAVESPAFTRVMPVIATLGESSALAEALLAAPDENWLPTFYNTGRGTVIARVSGIEPASAKNWETLKDQFMQQFQQRKSFEVVAAFMKNALGAADIVETPGVLEQLRFK